ncbi:hypothetical protein WL05_05315 [Burkholderia ubonensis]|uniref:helix-turn-helix domain-containing protein n=1 Tax=Burkholderia ubonensis TaxID=101571 RepID=UPI00075B5F55|nr:hypothetical protein WJ51_24000 [Burkholderia ubonensis]KVM11759.1 hypothetical protein WJ52_01055 [Burkholderia ubonensis]KVM44419.1 hypothetical protein WJ56_27745 [Burkholderia ubonensis]KVN70822.1 hypothetical protein WJ67_25585 [Burkholderia ubonensis]KVX56995.1 hypothetical protein WL05_05315 [Burkholderia ubonensis]
MDFPALRVDFSDRLAKPRLQRGFPQLQLADYVHVHIVQIIRYESQTHRPNIDVLKRLAVALSASTDTLSFD